MKTNVFKTIFLTIFLLFLCLYITQALGYYEYSNRKTNIMTEEAVKQFEKDLKDGRSVKASDYIKKENDYNNNLSRLGITISNIVGDIFDSTINFIFNNVSKVVDS